MISTLHCSYLIQYKHQKYIEIQVTNKRRRQNWHLFFSCTVGCKLGNRYVHLPVFVCRSLIGTGFCHCPDALCGWELCWWSWRDKQLSMYSRTEWWRFWKVLLWAPNIQNLYEDVLKLVTSGIFCYGCYIKTVKVSNDSIYGEIRQLFLRNCSFKRGVRTSVRLSCHNYTVTALSNAPIRYLWLTSPCVK